jgi:hypothetical protein
LILCLTASAAQPAGDEIAGVGVELGVEGQNIVVKRILPDTPARKDYCCESSRPVAGGEPRA